MPRRMYMQRRKKKRKKKNEKGYGNGKKTSRFENSQNYRGKDPKYNVTNPRLSLFCGGMRAAAFKITALSYLS